MKKNERNVSLSVSKLDDEWTIKKTTKNVAYISKKKDQKKNFDKNTLKNWWRHMESGREPM